LLAAGDLLISRGEPGRISSGERGAALGLAGEQCASEQQFWSPNALKPRNRGHRAGLGHRRSL